MSMNLPDREGGDPTSAENGGSWSTAARRAVEAGHRHDFDPDRVPMYPMLRAELRQTEAGDLEGLVDDELVARGTELEPVRTAILTVAAEKAGNRMGPVKAIRVRVTAPDGSVFHSVVDAAGGIHDVSGAPAETPGAAKGGKKPRPGQQNSKRVSVLFLAVMLVPLLLVGAPVAVIVAAMTGGDDPESSQTAPEPTQLPVVAPAPYSAVAAWSVNLTSSTVATDAASHVAADAERVYALRGDGTEVAGYTAASGVREWSAREVLDDAVTLGPALATVDGDLVLVVASTGQLAFLDPETGDEEGRWDLPATNQGVQVTATGPVVFTDSAHAQIVHDGDLVTRVVPATGTPVAPTSTGALVVVGAQGEVWVSASDNLAGDPRQVTAPPGTVFDALAGWTGDQLVLAYRPRKDSGDNRVRLVALDARSWSTRWITDWTPGVYESTLTGAATAPLTVAPGGEWGIYGSTALDLTTGSTMNLPKDWETTAIAAEQAFGTGRGRPLVATRAGATEESLSAPRPPDTYPLVGPQAAGGKHVYVVSSSGSKDVLFALQLTSEQEDQSR